MTTEPADSWVPAIREVASELKLEAGDHPSPDELFAYQAGELGDHEVASIRRHLGLCSECLQVILDLEAFSVPDDEETSAGMTNNESVALWEEIAREVDASSPPSPPGLGLVWPKPTSNWRRLEVAFAALSLITIAFGSLWIVELKGQIDELTGPQTNIAIFDVLPKEEAGLRGADSWNEVTVDSNARKLVLVLVLGATPSVSDFRIDVLDDAGIIVYRTSAVKPMPSGSFNIEFSELESYSGDYEINLYGLDGSRSELIASYPVKIRPFLSD